MASERHRVGLSSWGDPCVSQSPSFLLCAPILVQTERAQLEDGRFVYRLLRSPMCEYLVNFLHKLRQLPERYMMNSVLENFTILQVMHWGWAGVGALMWWGVPTTDPQPGDLTQGDPSSWGKLTSRTSRGGSSV